MVYLDVIEADHVLRFAAAVGQRKPIHAAASGRALLSMLDQGERQRIAASLDYEVFTASTPMAPSAAIRRAAANLGQLNN